VGGVANFLSIEREVVSKYIDKQKPNRRETNNVLYVELSDEF